MVEIYRTVAGDVYQPVGIEILEIGLVLALVGGLAYGVAGTCRAEACATFAFLVLLVVVPPVKLLMPLMTIFSPKDGWLRSLFWFSL